MIPKGYTVVVRRFIKAIPEISKKVRLVCDINTRYRLQNSADIRFSPTHHRIYAVPETLRYLPIANSIHLVIEMVPKRMQSSIVTLKLNVAFSMLRKSNIVKGL